MQKFLGIAVLAEAFDCESVKYSEQQENVRD